MNEKGEQERQEEIAIEALEQAKEESETISAEPVANEFSAEEQAQQSKDYGSDKFEKLDGIEAVRLRPGMYVGDSSTSGLHRLVYEAVDNAIDEAMAGYCKNISVTLHGDNSVTITDDGRGIPCDMNEKYQKTGVELALTELHAGTKFSKDVYGVSGGLHGVGISVANILSEWFEVEVARNGFVHRMDFKRAIPSGPLEQISKTNKTGTMVSFKPDAEIFEVTIFDFKILSARLKELAYLTPGVKIKITDERTDVTEVYKYDGGLKAFIKDLNKNKIVLHDKIIYFLKEFETEFIRKGVDGKVTERKKAKVFVEAALQFTDAFNEIIFSFANNINTFDGGTHVSGLKTALTRTVNAYAKNRKLIKANETAPQGEDIRTGLTAIVSVKLPDPQFRSQSKNELRNAEIQGFVEVAINEELGNFLEENPSISRVVVDNALRSARGRMAAKRARELARRKSVLASGSLPGKLADCSSRDVETTEIFLVEGDSAGGSAKQGRDRKFQAILPLRGKILNVEKARLDKMLNHEEISTIISALGCGIGSEEFDIEKLRYGKIIIMTDADVDGSHIRTLLLTFFFRHMPHLVENGNVYIAQPPLYLVKRKGKSEYVYDDRAMSKTLLNLGVDGATITINNKELAMDTTKDLMEILEKIENLSMFIMKKGIHFKKYISLLDDQGRLPGHLIKEDEKQHFFYDDRQLKQYIEEYEATHAAEESQLDLIDMERDDSENEEEEESGPKVVELIEHKELEKLVKLLQEMNIGVKMQNYFDDSTSDFALTIDVDGEPQVIHSLSTLLETIRTNGRKGINLQRYKGLGEMNPDQLWETTMDPATRTLKKIAIEDRMAAEQMFTVLMGSEVQPRREFIETHALETVNLDI